MANKLSAYIDLAKLQGAYRLNLKGKDGQMNDCIVINLGKSRAKPSQRDNAKVHLSLSLVPNRDGKDDFGQTHWVVEPQTREEREAQDTIKLPIIGNAREFDDNAGPRSAPKPRPAAGQETGGDDGQGLEEDEIPF